MWTAPPSSGFEYTDNAIACNQMSGLSVQINLLAKMVFATRVPNTWATICVPVQSSDYRGYRPIGRSIYSFLQVRLPGRSL